MFSLQRREVLDESTWKPEEARLRYIEARIFENTSNALTPDTYQEGDLDDQDVNDWLCQQGNFAKSSNPLLGKEEGGIRLLICERFGFQPLEFGLSKASLLAIETKFGLPIDMLPIFKSIGGGFSHQILRLNPGDPKPEQLVITVKVPQMLQIANYGLCVTHSFKTNITLGFIFGWHMIKDKNWKSFHEREGSTEHLKSHGTRISNLIKSEVPNWKHPLLLPVILLEDHVYNADICKGFDLSPRTTALEKRLRATKAGRNGKSSESLNFEELNQNVTNQRFEIITDINTIVTDVVTFTCNLKWDNRYCQFLRDISKTIGELSEGGDPKLENTIETLAVFVDSILEHAESLKTRLDIQLNVLYNLVAQVDSNVNATIAATTGLDSIAMKALAFVTTIFLPPTFVATLFSMSMFDWQADAKSQSPDSEEGTKVVSRHFGMYWVISLPLTIAVLSTWRAWWHREKNHYRRKYPHVNLDSVGPNFPIDFTKMMWWRKQMKDIEKSE